MSLLKYIGRLQQMDQLIRMKATGSSEEFAEKVGISRSLLMEHLREMRELGADITYDAYMNTYYYQKEGNLVIGFMMKKDFKGGNIMRDEISVFNDIGIFSLRYF